MEWNLAELLARDIEKGEDIFAHLDEYCDVIVEQNLGAEDFFWTFDDVIRGMRGNRARTSPAGRLKMLQAITAIPLNLHEARKRFSIENPEVALRIPQIADDTKHFPYWVNRVLAHLTDRAGKQGARNYAIWVVVNYHPINSAIEKLLKLYILSWPRFPTYMPVPYVPFSTFTRQLKLPAREALRVRQMLAASKALECPACGFKLRYRDENGSCNYCSRKAEQQGLDHPPRDIHYAREFGVGSDLWELTGRVQDSATGIAVMTSRDLAK